MNNETYKLIYTRAQEIQPQILVLIENLKEEGLTKDDIMIEVSFALINEGYRLKELAGGIKVSTPHERRLQTKIEGDIQDELYESKQYKEKDTQNE